MTLRLTLSVLHLLALGIGFWAVFARGQALREAVAPATPDAARGGALRRAFLADAHWGLAALLWISTGLWRLLAETEKSVAYYMSNGAFHAKMGLLALILVLEVWPMVTLIRWRIALARSGAPESVAAPAAARRIATVSYLQGALLVGMIVAAAAMARGVGARG